MRKPPAQGFTKKKLLLEVLRFLTKEKQKEVFAVGGLLLVEIHTEKTKEIFSRRLLFVALHTEKLLKEVFILGGVAGLLHWKVENNSRPVFLLLSVKIQWPPMRKYFLWLFSGKSSSQMSRTKFHCFIRCKSLALKRQKLCRYFSSYVFNFETHGSNYHLKFHQKKKLLKTSKKNKKCVTIFFVFQILLLQEFSEKNLPYQGITLQIPPPLIFRRRGTPEYFLKDFLYKKTIYRYPPLFFRKFRGKGVSVTLSPDKPNSILFREWLIHIFYFYYC